MPFIKLQFKPGVNRDQTTYSNEGGWYACDKIRFRSGYPEKLGGWTKTMPNPFSGYCRQMWNWVTSYSDDLLALGTNSKVYIEIRGTLYDITPFGGPLVGSNTFDVISGSNAVRVTTTADLPSWLVTGEPVKIAGFSAALGGIPASMLNGVKIVTVTGTNSFTYSPGMDAPTTASVSGAQYTVQAEIEPGNALSISGFGWGTSGWGRGAWGSELSSGSGWGTSAWSRGTWGSGGDSLSPVILPQQDWFFDNFGNDLVMNIRGGSAYWWGREIGVDPDLATHAISLQDYAAAEGYDANAVPSRITQLMVSQQDRHLIAFGAVPFGYTTVDDFDPLLIRWADQDTPGDWTPQQTNTAGDIRLSRGSRIIRALPTRQEILVWTDTHLYTLQFLGTLDVFGVQEYADNISVASPRAMATAANITYWMGQDKFYAYTGRVETLPCTLRDHVFNNINLGQSDQIICGTNEQWNEVWWFYPTADSDYNNAYVVYNHLERIWYYGTLGRTAWLDTAIRHYPQAANTEGGTTFGYLYSHENGLDADGDAMNSYIESSDFDLGDGDQFMLTRRILPDVNFANSTAGTPQVTLRVRYRNFPGNTLRSDPSDAKNVIESTVGVYTDQVFIRARARQMALRVQSDTLGVQWQLGAPRIDARGDGRR